MLQVAGLSTDLAACEFNLGYNTVQQLRPDELFLIDRDIIQDLSLGVKISHDVP